MENEKIIPLNNDFFTALKIPDFKTVDRLPKREAERLLNEVKVDFTEELNPPQPCIMVNDSIIGTLGNFSLVIGKAKSRKSFFLVVAVASATKRGVVLDQFKGCLPENHDKVLYFDTEQGKYHVQKAASRICKLVGEKEPQNLTVYGLRKFRPEKRLALIEHAIYNSKNVGLVVVDGVRDIVTSINDEEQATKIASKLLRWTEERNIHIITVLHQNKSDNNARGHLGSELVNKAETVLSVTKDEREKDISIVQAEYCRDKEPSPFAFEINDEGLPQLISDWELRTKPPHKLRIDDIEDHKKYKLLIEIFPSDEEYGYSELRIQLKLAYVAQFNNSIGDNKVKELITYCKNKGWLTQEKAKSPYKLGKYNS